MAGYSGVTYEDYIKNYSDLAKATESNSLAEKKRSNAANLAKSLAGFDKSKLDATQAYDTGVANVNAQTNKQLPQYTQNANQISANTRMSARRLAEIMASRGLLKSGGALMRQSGIYNQGNSDLAQNIRDKTSFMEGQSNKVNELATTRSNALAEIARQVALAQQEAAANEQLYQEQYNNALTAAPLQAALSYPEIYNSQMEQSGSMLDAIMDYNVAMSQLQGATQIPSGFKYGDAMINLMKQLGLIT